MDKLREKIYRKDQSKKKSTKYSRLDDAFVTRM